MSRAWRYLSFKIGADIILVNFAFISAFLVKFKTLSFISVITVYYKPLLFITILWLVVLNLAGLYKIQHNKVSQVDNLFSVSFGVFSAAFFTYVIIIFLYREAFYSREVVIIGSLCSLVLLNVSRYLIWKFYKR